MAAVHPPLPLPGAVVSPRSAGKPFPWVPVILVTIALAYLALFLFVPLAAVFTEAFKKGATVYWDAIREPDAWSAIQLTLIAAAIAVPL
ncbi:MAG: hypothetical protein ABI790_16280, partial [Betaproteobacteria bacterium]